MSYIKSFLPIYALIKVIFYYYSPQFNSGHLRATFIWSRVTNIRPASFTCIAQYPFICITYEHFHMNSNHMFSIYARLNFYSSVIKNDMRGLLNVMVRLMVYILMRVWRAFHELFGENLNWKKLENIPINGHNTRHTICKSLVKI